MGPGLSLPRWTSIPNGRFPDSDKRCRLMTFHFFFASWRKKGTQEDSPGLRGRAEPRLMTFPRPVSQKKPKEDFLQLSSKKQKIPHSSDKQNHGSWPSQTYSFFFFFFILLFSVSQKKEENTLFRILLPCKKMKRKKSLSGLSNQFTFLTSNLLPLPEWTVGAIHSSFPITYPPFLLVFLIFSFSHLLWPPQQKTI